MPYLGLTLAVAAGIALAPFFWWIAAAAVCCAPIAWYIRRALRNGWPFWSTMWALLAFLAVLAVFAWWAIWLARRGQWADAIFVVVLYLALGIHGILTRKRPAAPVTETAAPER